MAGAIRTFLATLLRPPRNAWRRLVGAPDHVVLVLEGPLHELPDPPGPWYRRWVAPSRPNLRDLAEVLRRLRLDPRVKGIVLRLGTLEAPLARVQALRDLLAEVREAGKRVTVWAAELDGTNLAVALAADEVLVQPGALVGPLGLRQGYVFLADALERLGVAVDLAAVSPYKTAGDVLTRSSMSEEHRQQAERLLDDLYAGFLDDLAAARGVDRAGAEALVDGAPYTDEEALAAGLVDGIVSEEDLARHLGTAEEPASLAPWSHASKRVLLARPRRGRRVVALLRVEGSIVMGASRRSPGPAPPLPFLLDERTGDRSVVAAVRALRESRRVAAVVLHVESGGGSAAASEAMAAALAELASEKPLVASMGAVAASGGYYVTTPARWVVAEPATLTGSIGVITGKVVDAGGLASHGIHREVLTRGAGAAILDPGRRWTEAERERVEASLQRTYDLFLTRVVEGRGLDRSAVEPLAGGRVWTGREALERGLVDELGGLDAAVARARELAGLPDGCPVVEAWVGGSPAWRPPGSAELLDHATRNLALLREGRALCLLPWVPRW